MIVRPNRIFAFLFCIQLFTCQPIQASKADVFTFTAMAAAITTAGLTLALVFPPIFRATFYHKYKAPKNAQALAAHFFDAMEKEKTGIWQKICSSYKKLFGLFTVYQGAKDAELKRKNSGADYTLLPQGGIHLPAHSFLPGKKPSARAQVKLCHEVAHVQQDSFLLVPAFYQQEYEAEYTAVQTLYALGKYQELWSMLRSTLRLLAKLDNNYTEENLKRLHPYIYGALNGYADLLEQHPGDSQLKLFFNNLLSGYSSNIRETVEKAIRQKEKRTWQQREAMLQQELKALRQALPVGP